MYYKTLRCLSILNHKGGVAKTTISKLVSEFAVMFKELRILGVDLDPQGNFSKRFIEMTETETEINGIVLKQMNPPPHPAFDPADPDWEQLSVPPPGYWSTAQLFRYGYCEPYDTLYDNFKIIPAHTTELTDLMLEVGRRAIENDFISVLHNVLLDDYYQDNFDLVIIDTPPQLSPITLAAVRASTHILIPTLLDEDSLEGMHRATSMWTAENTRRNSDEEIRLAGIIPTQADLRSAQQLEFLKQIEDSSLLRKYLIKPMRRMETYKNTSMSRAEPKSLFQLTETNVARKEAMQFCEEIIKRTMQS